MNIDVAKEIYTFQYFNKMSFEEFINMLQHGISLIQQYPGSDKLFISRTFPPEAQQSINIALTYNQELIVKELMIP